MCVCPSYRYKPIQAQWPICTSLARKYIHTIRVCVTVAGCVVVKLFKDFHGLTVNYPIGHLDIATLEQLLVII